MKSLITCSSIVLAMMLASCKGPKPMISNLEKGTYEYETLTNPANILGVTVSILPIAKSPAAADKPVTFLDMRDSLPHLYLRLMAGKTPNAEALMKLLAQPILPVEQKAPERKPTDFTEYKVQFAFSNLKRYYTDSRFMHANTRLEFLTTSLSIPAGSPILFYNIDRLQNEFDDIDLGTLSRDQTVTLNAKAGIQGGLGTSYSNVAGDKNTSTSGSKDNTARSVYDADGNVLGTIGRNGELNTTREGTNNSTTSADAKVSANVEGSYQNMESIKEAVAAKLKRLRTGFNFSDKKLTIAQRGRPSGDISDNIYVTATLTVADPTTVFPLPVHAFEHLYDKDNKPNKADAILFSSRLVNFVPCDSAADIQLTTAFEGAVRAVGNEKGNSGENALEYDDKVTYFSIPATAGDPLTIGKNAYCKNAYKFTATAGGDDGYVLHIRTPKVSEVDIFEDDDPKLMLQWLLDVQANPVAAQLSSGKFELYFESYRTGTRINIIKGKMTPTDINAIRSLTWIKAEKRLP